MYADGHVISRDRSICRVGIMTAAEICVCTGTVLTSSRRPRRDCRGDRGGDVLVIPGKIRFDVLTSFCERTNRKKD